MESAIYDLVEPFEEKKRDFDNEKEELECDLEELRYASWCNTIFKWYTEKI